MAGAAAGVTVAAQVALAIAEGLLAGLLGGGVAGEAERATVDPNLDVLGLQAVEGNFKDVALGGDGLVETQGASGAGEAGLVATV